MEFLLLVAVCYIAYLHIQKVKTKKYADKKEKDLVVQCEKKIAESQQQIKQLDISIARKNSEVSLLQKKVKTLEPFQVCADATVEAELILQSAKDFRTESNRQAQEQYSKMVNQGIAERDEASRRARESRARSEMLIKEANAQATLIVVNAKGDAERIAGDAYRALKDADALKSTATAISNVIKGYGDHYLKPTFGLLDELAALYSFDDAGKQLKMARERTQFLVSQLQAAECDYVEQLRRTTAIHFVVDAFNGKVDTILTRAKQDNYGTLEQQIKDAFAIVNHHGTAFKSARITDEYLNARIQELRWAVAVHAVREREKEEQREIRERIREEERARREIEKALKEAAKEEEAIEKAMARMRQQIEKASDEQRAKYEEQLADLTQRLVDAEAKSQRAQSMAQQTRAGHVYIISNIGSFGEEVFKIGMTRRLDPLDRVRELGDASVPFAFDVHAMIWSEDAPALERELHIEFMRAQVNKINPRKEFFRVGISMLRDTIEKRGIDVSWTMAAAAAEYRETLAIEEKMLKNSALEQEWLQQQKNYEIQLEPELLVES